jgi:hypothetical protein
MLSIGVLRGMSIVAVGKEGVLTPQTTGCRYLCGTT